MVVCLCRLCNHFRKPTLFFSVPWPWSWSGADWVRHLWSLLLKLAWHRGLGIIHLSVLVLLSCKEEFTPSWHYGNVPACYIFMCNYIAMNSVTIWTPTKSPSPYGTIGTHTIHTINTYLMNGATYHENNESTDYENVMLMEWVDSCCDTHAVLLRGYVKTS